MDRHFNLRNLGWMLLLFVLIALIGLGPRAHQVMQSMQQAGQAVEAGSPSEAADHLARAAEQQPWRADLWELAGHYALIAGEPERAILYLNKAEATSVHGLTLHGRLDLAQAYYLAEDQPSAQRAWESANRQFGPSHDASSHLAKLYREQGDYPAAITVLEQLAERFPDDAAVHFELALLYAASGEVGPAQQALERAAELNPDLAGAAEELRAKIALARRQADPAYAPLLICQGLAALEKWALAAEACQQSIELYPGYAEAWAYLGLAYKRLAAQDARTDGSDGLAELETALELDPQSLAANSLMAMYWMEQGRYELALESMRTAVALAPERADLYVDLGALLALSGDLQAAYDAYLQAVELASQKAIYLRHLADFSLKYEYMVEQVAITAARRAVIIAPNDPANLDQMAQVMIHLGDLASAERFARRAVSLDPDYAPAHLRLSLVYLLQGDREASRQALDRVMTLAPDTPVGAQARRLLEIYFP
jgi:tetratricopeptide (TPR) repeat protein